MALLYETVTAALVQARQDILDDAALLSPLGAYRYAARGVADALIEAGVLEPADFVAFMRAAQAWEGERPDAG